MLVITDHKPLVSMFKKDVATLSQCIQHILLKIHQYRVQIIHKPGPEIFIADWLWRHNHAEGKDKPIKGMDVQVDAIQAAMEMSECISMAEIQQASSIDNHLQQLKGIIIAGWPDSRDELHAELQLYWSYRDELAVIDGVILKGKCIMIPNSLKEQVLNQLHTNDMGIEKTKLLAHECVYWPSINADIKKYITQWATCLQFQQTQPQERIIHHEITLWPWEVVGADMFHYNNKNYLCLVDYNSKFPVIKRLEGPSAENLINAVKIIFMEYGIPHKLMSDAGTNFVSDRFWKFCKAINIEQATSLVYHHQVTGRLRPASNLLSELSKNVLNPVGTSIWPYYRYIQHYEAQVYWAQQHYYLTDKFEAQCLSKTTNLLGRTMMTTIMASSWTGSKKWQWYLTNVSLYPYRVNCSSPARRQQTMDPWDCSRQWQLKPPLQVIHNPANNKWKMHHRTQMTHKANNSNSRCLPKTSFTETMSYNNRPTGRNIK